MNKLKLHLGCGDRYLPGYIHIDIDNKPHIDYPGTDISKLPMFKDNSVDLIYTCGTFEYFDREDGLNVLKEWNRILKSNGCLYISVPDFKSITDVYNQNNNNLDGEGILGPIFGKWKYTDKTGESKFIYHKTVYDFKSLSKMLLISDYNNIEKYDCWEFLPNTFDDFSKAYMPYKDRNGIQMSVNIKCKKI